MQAQTPAAANERAGYYSGPERVGGPGVRCRACGRKLAEHISLSEGRVLILCRHCKRLNVFTEAGQKLA